MRHIYKLLEWWGKPYPTNGSLFLAVLPSATFASLSGILAMRADMNAALNDARWIKSHTTHNLHKIRGRPESTEKVSFCA